MGIVEIFSFAGSVLGFIGGSAIISGLILRRIDKFEKKLDRRESDRIKENLMRSELLLACDRLCEANTEELRKLMSEDICETELCEAREARSRLEAFIRAKSAEYLHSV